MYYSYAKNVKIVSDRYRDQMSSPMEIAVHWVKHVAKNKGAQHLRIGAIDLPFYVYYNLDVYSALFAVVALSLFAAKKCIHAVCGRLAVVDRNVNVIRNKLKLN